MYPSTPCCAFCEMTFSTYRVTPFNVVDVKKSKYASLVSGLPDPCAMHALVQAASRHWSARVTSENGSHSPGRTVVDEDVVYYYIVSSLAEL